MSKISTILHLWSLGINIPQTRFLQDPDNMKDLQGVWFSFPLIMRSSFAIEDSKEYAFAGMFNSYFPIYTIEDYHSWLVECRKIPERARLYGKKIWYAWKYDTPEIFLQEFISGDFSGVAFTQYQGDIIRMEIVPGILSPFVQWEISHPLIVEAPRNNVNNFRIISPYLDSRIFVIQDCLVVEKSFSGIWFESRVRQIIFDILTLVLRIESILGSPQDIEFTVKNNCIYILQSRPISIHV